MDKGKAKGRKDSVLVVRLEEDLKQMAADIAERSGVPISEVIRTMILTCEEDNSAALAKTVLEISDLQRERKTSYAIMSIVKVIETISNGKSLLTVKHFVKNSAEFFNDMLQLIEQKESGAVDDEHSDETGGYSRRLI